MKVLNHLAALPHSVWMRRVLPAYESLAVDDAMRAVWTRADRALGFFFFVNLGLAAIFGFIGGHWKAALIVAPLSAGLFYAAVWLRPGSYLTRAIAGVSTQLFIALFIYQLDGAAEVRVLFFVGVTMLVIYEDWRCLWPGLLVVLGLNVFFGALQNHGAELGFFPKGMVNSWLLVFQFAVASVHVALCGYWAHVLQHNTLAQSRRHKLLLQQRARLLEQLDRTLRSEADLQARTSELEETHLRMEADLEARRIVELELRRLTNDLEIANDELHKSIQHANQLAVSADAANKAKSSFLAVMSHEIRTPLNGVIGMASLMLESRLDSDQRASLETIQSSGSNLLMLLNDILDFSKIESGRFQIEVQPFVLREVIDGVVSLFKPQAEENGLFFSVKISDRVPQAICGDAGRLRQVLSNLVSNALKFTQHGAIIVEVDCLATEADGTAEIGFTVRDTGIGIPKDKHALLFQSFSQVDASTSRKYGGTGLGLVISQRLVELMGGRIGFESESGSGSTFSFTVRAAIESLKVENTRSVITESKLSSLPTSSRSLRVLLVEDNLINQKVATMMLGKLGYKPDAAFNGREAIDALARKDFDVIFMDWHMPEMNGIEATQYIRTHFPAERQPWIVAITANAITGDRERCLQAGMNDYIAKPLRAEDLVGALSRIPCAAADFFGGAASA